MAPPVFHLDGEVRRPENEDLGDADEDVVARVQVFDQLFQARQALRRRVAFDIETRPQAGQHGRLKLFTLQADQHLRDESEFVGGLLDMLHHRAEFAPPAVQEEGVDDGHQQENVALHHRRGIRKLEHLDHAQDHAQEGEQAGDACRRQDPKQDAQSLRGEKRRSFAPGGEGGGSDAGARFFGEDGEVFAQVQPGLQFGDGLVALANFRGAGRDQQPSRKRLFADVGAGGAEEFEERSLAEEVEVLRIRVGRVKVPVARFAIADPLALEAG